MFARLVMKRALPLKLTDSADLKDWQKSASAHSSDTTPIPPPSQPTLKKYIKATATCMRKDMSKHMRTILEKNVLPSANIQFDLWKGSHKRHELGIHLNCTDIDTGAGAVVHFCLGIYHITTAHTADNIIATIEEILGPAGYNIREFVNSGSSDNATNVVSPVQRMRLTQVGCQAHKQGQPGCEALWGGSCPARSTPMKWKISNEISILKYLIMAFSLSEKIVIQIVFIHILEQVTFLKY